MAVKNYTKNILIRAREEEARSWALRASESGKNLSTCIREVLNAWSGLSPRGSSPEVELEGEGSSTSVPLGQVTSSDHGGGVIASEGVSIGVERSHGGDSTLLPPSFPSPSSSPSHGGGSFSSGTVASSLSLSSSIGVGSPSSSPSLLDDLSLTSTSPSSSASIERDEFASLLDGMDFEGGG